MGGEEVEDVALVKPFTWCRTLLEFGNHLMFSFEKDIFCPTLKVKFLLQDKSKQLPICMNIKVLSHLQIFGHSKEGAQLCLGNVHLPVVHEVEHGQDAFILDAPQVEQGVVVWVSLQHPSKER